LKLDYIRILYVLTFKTYWEEKEEKIERQRKLKKKNRKRTRNQRCTRIKYIILSTIRLQNKAIEMEVKLAHQGDVVEMHKNVEVVIVEVSL